MTGLDPETDRIIEVALVVTDPDLNILAEGPFMPFISPMRFINGMDAWNRGTHGRSGLIDRVRASNITEAMAEDALIEFLEPYVPKGKSPMCGNTICQDRRFMAKTMPKLEAYFHYRNLDVSTLKDWPDAGNPDWLTVSKRCKSIRHWPISSNLSRSCGITVNISSGSKNIHETSGQGRWGKYR